MQSEELIPHLFRTEYRKIVAVLCKHFGFDQMEIAEDLASDTFLTAAETWGQKGVPANPTAWLYSVAKNRAKNYLKRSHIFQSRLVPGLKGQAGSGAAGSGPAGSIEDEIDLSPQNINDSQLQMMFAVCHPAISPEAQVGLALRILCGFGIEEIADAFLTNKETINKRLFRAKEKIREEKIKIEMPGPAEIESRLAAVLTTIYLLFNEGYYSLSQNASLRKDLCFEAIRLCCMLIEIPEPCEAPTKFSPTNTPEANALLSLMLFHASRFEARLDENGELVLYGQQDTSLWNSDLISKGAYFLNRAATGDHLSKYHLEAGIAYWNTQRDDTKEKWSPILQLYDLLLQVEYSPMAALNRIYALSKVNGKEEAIREAEKLKLDHTHFYFALLGELYTGIDNAKAETHLRKALALSKAEAERVALQKKIGGL